MGITSLRRHLYPQVVKATTIADVVGEPMHSSGLTMREYNEIAKEVSKMSDKDILESVNDINKATTISTLEPVNGDISRWEEESPANTENKNENEEKKENEESVLVTTSNSYTITKTESPYIILSKEDNFNDLVENVPVVAEPIKKKRTYKRKINAFK